MSDRSEKVPPRLQEIMDEFSWLEGREKLELLLEYSEKMPPLPDWLNKLNANGGVILSIKPATSLETVFFEILHQQSKAENPEIADDAKE